MRPVSPSSAADGGFKTGRRSVNSCYAHRARGSTIFLALRHARSRNRPCVAKCMTSLLAGQLKLARSPIMLGRKAPRAGSSAVIGIRGAVAARRSRSRCSNRVWEPWLLLVGIEVVLGPESTGGMGTGIDGRLEHCDAPGQVLGGGVAVRTGDVRAQPVPERLHGHRIGAVAWRGLGAQPPRHRDRVLVSGLGTGQIRTWPSSLETHAVGGELGGAPRRAGRHMDPYTPSRKPPNPYGVGGSANSVRLRGQFRETWPFPQEKIFGAAKISVSPCVARNGGCRARRGINHRAVQCSVDDAHGEDCVDAAKSDAVASVGEAWFGAGL